MPRIPLQKDKYVPFNFGSRMSSFCKTLRSKWHLSVPSICLPVCILLLQFRVTLCLWLFPFPPSCAGRHRCAYWPQDVQFTITLHMFANFSFWCGHGMHLMYLLALTYVIYSHSIKKRFSWFFVFVVSGSCGPSPGMSSVGLSSKSRAHMACPQTNPPFKDMSSPPWGCIFYASTPRCLGCNGMTHGCPSLTFVLSHANACSHQTKWNSPERRIQNPKSFASILKSLLQIQCLRPCDYMREMHFFRMTIPQQSMPACNCFDSSFRLCLVETVLSVSYLKNCQLILAFWKMFADSGIMAILSTSKPH